MKNNNIVEIYDEYGKSIHGNSIMTRYIITVNVNQNHLNGYMK